MAFLLLMLGLPLAGAGASALSEEEPSAELEALEARFAALRAETEAELDGALAGLEALVPRREGPAGRLEPQFATYLGLLEEAEEAFLGDAAVPFKERRTRWEWAYARLREDLLRARERLLRVQERLDSGRERAEALRERLRQALEERAKEGPVRDELKKRREALRRRLSGWRDAAHGEPRDRLREGMDEAASFSFEFDVLHVALAAGLSDAAFGRAAAEKAERVERLRAKEGRRLRLRISAYLDAVEKAARALRARAWRGAGG